MCRGFRGTEPTKIAMIMVEKYVRYIYVLQANPMNICKKNVMLSLGEVP